MKLLLMQSDIKWENPTANRERFTQEILTAEDADLIVLPEMFTTGFCTAPKGVAEPAEGPTLEWMLQTAKKKGAALAGSVAVEEGERYFNRFYFVRPDGRFQQYDKRHLFTFGGENLEYTGGQERVIVEYMGWRILLQVCYDLRFPVWSRNRNDYDLILYVASWPSVRIGVWSALLKARAIENLCYVAGVNRVGSDPNCEYNGGSVLHDYLGNPLAEALPGQEALLSGELSKADLNAFRRKFPALNDADAFTLTQ